MNKIIVIVVLLFVGVIGLGIFVDSNKPEQKTYTPEEARTLVDTDYIVGDRDASVVFVEYSDLQCPACRGAYPIVQELKSDFADQDVAFVIRDFPLYFHRQAPAAAAAQRAAQAQGAYEEMRELLFTQQDVWSNNPNAASFFESFAEELGLDIEQFNADRNSEEIKVLVQEDLAKGMALGVNSTPTFFINGVQITDNRTLEGMRAAIQRALDEAASAPEEESATTTEEGGDA